MKFILLTILFVSTLAFGQFSTFKKGEKVGLSFKGSEITKAKYDSITLKSNLVATAYKKSKVYYLNQQGENIYKGKVGQLYPFTEYVGLINKGDEWNVIKASGEKVFSYDLDSKPNVIGQFVLKRSQYIPSTLYDIDGNFFNGVKYKYCHPFRNGRAWLGEGTYFYTIDTNGKKYTNVKANVVEYIDHGYYLVEYNRKWGVVNDKFELVVPFKYHFRPKVDGRRIFEYKGIPAEEELIYEIPE